MIKLGTLLCVLMYSGFSYADIYKHVDGAGNVFYTDTPEKGLSYKRILKTKPKAKKVKKSNYQNLAKNKKKYGSLIAKAAAKYDIDAKLLHAVILTESAYDVDALSSAGAVGLMQLMPATAKRYGVKDRTNAGQNIDGGAHYIKDLLAMFKSNLYLVLASYNAGENAVKKYNNSIPPYPETRRYVNKVLKSYRNS
jgi:soluble lytic murein transglycosylase-like protein